MAWLFAPKKTPGGAWILIARFGDKIMRMNTGQRLRWCAGLALFAASVSAHAAGHSLSAKPVPAMASDPDIAVTVNGNPIKRAIIDQLARARAGVQNPYDEALHPRQMVKPETFTSADRTQLIEDLVGMEVLVQKAREIGLHQRPQVIADLELQQKTLLSEYMVREIIKDIKIDPAEVTARHAAQKSEPQHRISHILLRNEVDAKAAVAELDRGASFEKVAAARSIDRSGGKDGSLGWLTENQMLEPIAIMVRSLSPGTHAHQPVHTEFGWHVIRLHESREFKKPLNEQLKNELRAEILQEKVDLRLRQLRQPAKVEVHSTR
jgi:peptidyl-prolyl cis-trans isomerase C